MNGHIAPTQDLPKQSQSHTSAQLEFNFEFADDLDIWTDTEIWQLREGILIDAIRMLLDGRVSLKFKKEVLSWVQDDTLSPFCFRVCSMAAVVDSDALRESVLWLVKRHSHQLD